MKNRVKKVFEREPYILRLVIYVIFWVFNFLLCIKGTPQSFAFPSGTGGLNGTVKDEDILEYFRKHADFLIPLPPVPSVRTVYT
jgi:hypothetical protein